MPGFLDVLKQAQNTIIVVDMRSPFVAIGTLVDCSADFLHLEDADLHDLRDTDTSREIYVMKVARYGVQANRKRVLLRMDDVLAVARLEDVVTG
jgi:small nuclear ribonucleoprotein (snRNP)-like protein